MLGRSFWAPLIFAVFLFELTNLRLNESVEVHSLANKFRIVFRIVESLGSFFENFLVFQLSVTQQPSSTQGIKQK